VNKIYLTILLTFISIFSLGNINTYANESKADTEMNVLLEKGSNKTDDTKDKDTNYKPTPAEYVKKLPQTGEIITSFLIIMIGFSILLFILLLLFNKYTYYNEWRFY